MIKMLKYGIYAKSVELLCFKPALARLVMLHPEMDMKSYRRSVKREYRAMLLRTLAQGDECCDFHVTKIKEEK